MGLAVGSIAPTGTPPLPSPSTHTCTYIAVCCYVSTRCYACCESLCESYSHICMYSHSSHATSLSLRAHICESLLSKSLSSVWNHPCKQLPLCLCLLPEEACASQQLCISIDTCKGHGAHKAQPKADRHVQMTDSITEVVYLASAGTCYMQ